MVKLEFECEDGLEANLLMAVHEMIEDRSFDESMVITAMLPILLDVISGHIKNHIEQAAKYYGTQFLREWGLDLEELGVGS
jgi:hypothetical protein